jgi:predicted  nucleic acid-binding Zn-ribbon protein
VESAHHDLRLMVRLQEIYQQIADALTQRATPPDDVQRLQEENRQRQLELEEREARLAALEEVLRTVRKKEQESQTELEHFQKQKGMVTNEREFTAVISEIDFATKALQEASARRAELEAELAALAEDLAGRRNARPEEEAAQREVLAAWEAQKAEFTAGVHTLSEQAKALEAELQPGHRSRFLRLLQSKRGQALAPVVEGSCSLCHYELRPHVQQRVRRAEEIIYCEHCNRILYLPEHLSPEG